MDTRRLAIDPNAPSKEEIEAHNRMAAAHNMKVAKADLAGACARALCANPGVPTSDIGRIAVGISEFILETYSLMPDAEGNKGGLVS